MPTVQETLDRLGKPPVEICLDWAWQLRQFPKRENKKIQTGRLAPHTQPANSDTHAAWNTIALDDQGILSYTQAAAPLSTLCLNELIAQVLHWSQPQNLTNDLRVIHDYCSPADSESKLNGEAQPAQVNFCLITTHTTSPTALSLTSSGNARSRLATPRQRRPKISFRPHLSIATIVVGIAVFAGICLVSSLRLSNSIEPKHTIATTGSTQPTLRASSPSLPNDVTQTTTDEYDQNDDVGNLQRSVEALSLTNELLLPAATSFEATTSLASSTAVETGTPEVGASDEIALAPPANSSQSETMIDVLRELTTLTESAEKQTLENMIPAAGQSAENADSVPLILTVAPANQLQVFDKTIRARQPSWKLRLVVSDGFTALPSQAQLVSRREGANWLIQEDTAPKENAKSQWYKSAAKPNPTQLMVQSQLVNPRQTSLRWRIAAGAKDFPGLAIPLDQVWLDRAQITLRNQTQWLQTELERNHMLRAIDGLPSEARTNLASRRRELETQHKLATRWLEIVADAHQLQGWLDGQVEFHAELLDAAQNPLVTLLRFGTP